jgi:TIGR02757 family protein
MIIKKQHKMNLKTKAQLKEYAARYETTAFLKEDPARFMHLVQGANNQETMAFIAANLSYGNRKQFFPKINFMLEKSQGEPYNWVKSGLFEQDIPPTDDCYYRLYTKRMMNSFLKTLQKLLSEHNTLHQYIQTTATNDAETAIVALCKYFAEHGQEGIVPINARSACKRICMFLRWMVRDNSPVDLGIWKDTIDKRTLIMPLDTHVLTQAQRLKLLKSKSTSMSIAKKLTAEMAKVFPNDPLKADFALFGYGVNDGQEI